MPRLLVLLFLAQVVLAACALISCLSAEDGEPRVLARLAWVMVILFVPLIGPIAWFLTRWRAGRATAGAGPFTRLLERERPRPLAPDDDPEFLRSISREQARKDRETSERRENNPRRGEDETRRSGGEPPVEDNRPEG